VEINTSITMCPVQSSQLVLFCRKSSCHMYSQQHFTKNCSLIFFSRFWSYDWELYKTRQTV